MASPTEVPSVWEGPPVPKNCKRFIITAAQNATPVGPVWKSLLQAASYYDAHLSVIPYRYKNPTSRWTGSQKGSEWWVGDVQPFLCNTRRELNKNLVVIGDVKIVPTAKDPLQGFEAHTGAESSIIGHPNLAFTPVATPGHKMSKIMSTTGSCTLPNYSDTRAGKQGLHQHVAGGLIVEIDGGSFWLRQLNANKKGEFMDLDKYFMPDGVMDAPPWEALVTGDAHVRKIDKTVDRAVFGKGGMVQRYKPKRIFVHDLWDGDTANPYQDKFEKLAQMKIGADNVEEEIKEAAQFLVERTPDGCEMVVVDSNHDYFLKRWCRDYTWDQVGLNGGFHLETTKFLWNAVHTKENVAQVPSPFKYWIEKFVEGKGKNIRVLREDESYSVAGVECGMHGHRGKNGSQGSLRNLVTIGVKFVIGHVHTPGIRFGGYAVGLMALLKMGYNKGPSSWLQTMCAIHGGACAGKRQLITIVDGRHRL